ncbi:hypothetical protein FRC02_004191 [Tulasnella sp. 418]|nr:hypothetical protein FRC02_004191 [Tulasnella sp. 418]
MASTSGSAAPTLDITVPASPTISHDKRDDDQDAIDEKTIQEVNEDSEKPKEVEAPATGPPDGGFRAWLVVAGVSASGLCTFGFANTFGVFQAYYTQELDGVTQSAIAWIGSLQYCLIFLPGLISGHLTDNGYIRQQLIVASIVLVVCIFLVAECKTLWQLVLCQGVGIGISSGFIFSPGMAMIPTWFHVRRARAYGIVAIGSSIGGTVLPIALRKLFDAVGFKWTIRILGFIIMALLLFYILVARPRVYPKKGAGGDSSISVILKNKPVMIYAIGATVIWFGLYNPLTFFDVYAQHIGIPKSRSFYTIVCANAASGVGRFSSGFMADYFGAVNVLVVFTFVAAIMCFAWPYAHSFGPLLVIAAIYGIASGAFIGLLPSPITRMVTPNLIGRTIGLSCMIMSVGTLVGNPIAGEIITGPGGFEAAGGYAGGTVLLACAIILLSKRAATGKWTGKF